MGTQDKKHPLRTTFVVQHIPTAFVQVICNKISEADTS